MKDSNNKYFKSFLVFHEQSLKKGLEDLSREAGHTSDYIYLKFLDHLNAENIYRKINKDLFKNIEKEMKE